MLQAQACSVKRCVWGRAGLHIDEQTAKFYLEDAHGDLKKAYQLHRAFFPCWSAMLLAWFARKLLVPPR